MQSCRVTLNVYTHTHTHVHYIMIAYPYRLPIWADMSPTGFRKLVQNNTTNSRVIYIFARCKLQPVNNRELLLASPCTGAIYGWYNVTYGSPVFVMRWWIKTKSLSRIVFLIEKLRRTLYSCESSPDTIYTHSSTGRRNFLYATEKYKAYWQCSAQRSAYNNRTFCTCVILCTYGRGLAVILYASSGRPSARVFLQHSPSPYP